eukprot:2693863-Pyramimonas_sp.AAC.1
MKFKHHSSRSPCARTRYSYELLSWYVQAGTSYKRYCTRPPETSRPTAKRRRRFSLSRQTEAQSHQKGRISATPNTVNHRALCNTPHVTE